MSFRSQLMAKAHEIQRLAREKRTQEIERERERKANTDTDGTPLAGPQLQPKVSSYDWVPELFAQFVEPDPESFDPIIDSMGATKRRLNSTVMESISVVKDSVLGWEGEAATNFREKICAPFPKIIDHQYALAAILEAAMEANQEIFVRSREDISKIADDTITALDALGECGGDEWAMALTVLAAVAGVAAAVVAPEVVLAVAFTAVASGASVASAAIPEHSEVPIGGDTVDAVLGNMHSAASDLLKGISSQEDVIIRAFQSDHDLMIGRQRTEIVAPRPMLANADAALIKTEFTPPT